jgi:O-antigen ligase
MMTIFEQRASQPSAILPVWVFLLGFAVFLPAVIGMLFLLAAWAVLGYRRWRHGEHLASISPAWWAVLGLLLAWPLISAWVNGPLPEMWGRWLHGLRVCLFVAFALTLPSRYKPVLLKGLVAGALYMAVVVLLHQWVFSLPDWAIWTDLLSVRGNSSSKLWIALAATAGCLLWVALQTAFAPSTRWAALAGWLAFSAMVGAYSISRNAHLLLAVLPAVVLVYKLGLTVRGLTLAVVALGLAGAMFTQMPSVENRMDQAVAELNDYKERGTFDTSSAVRLKMFTVAWDQMLQNPVTGTGLGSWQTAWYEASKNHTTMSGTNNPHNDFLLYGMETGIPGALLLVAVFVLIMRGAYQQRSFEGGIGWVFAWALLTTSTINAPFRDATIGMALIVFAVAFSARPQAQRPAF